MMNLQLSFNIMSTGKLLLVHVSFSVWYPLCEHYSFKFLININQFKFRQECGILKSELGCAAHTRFETNISEYEANIYSLRSE